MEPTRPKRAAPSICRSRSTARSWHRSRATSASVTTSRCVRAVRRAIGLALATPGLLRAQAPPATEVSTGVTVVLAHRGFWGPELGVARRAGGQGRFTLAAAGGDYERALGVRVEATAQFLLRPGERRAAGPYGGLGLAFVGAEGAPGASYLTALVGVEAAPGARAGWYAELGLGGGVRVVLGWRLRRFPAWW